MKKDQYDRNSKKIILFPGLKERLYEKGLECLEAKDFHNAAALLRDAKKLAPDDPDICEAYIMALYEDGAYEEAKSIAEALLREGHCDYYEVIEMYLMSLIQLNEHDVIIHTLESLFEEKEVPLERKEHFQTILQLSKKMIRNGYTVERANSNIEQALSTESSLHEQILQIASLADRNIQPYLETFMRILETKDSHPYLQTVVLNVLREHKIEREVPVKKLDYENCFIPAELPAIDEISFFECIAAELEKQLEHENPVLLEQLKEIISRHQFILYPFEAVPKNNMLWAAAYRGLGYELYGEEWSKEEIASVFGINSGELAEAFAYLIFLEQISSPNM